LTTEAVNRPVIVVGVDGSDRADRALDWSIAEAELRGLALRIVTAWHVPLVVVAAHPSTPPAGVLLKDLVREAAEGIAQAAERKVRQADLPVETQVIEGDAVDVLIGTSRGAALLALGASTHAGVAGALTSVIASCVRHAPAPTVVVH
jgi:nucleotide-binding universal stress UspA family protein